MADQPTSLVAHQSEADRRAKAEASKKAQLHSARMNGIKEGRGLATKELETKLGKTLVEQGLWPAQKHELEHQWALRERKHGWMCRFQGGISGLVLGVLLGGLGVYAAIDAGQARAFDAALESAARNVTTGYILRNADGEGTQRGVNPVDGSRMGPE